MDRHSVEERLARIGVQKADVVESFVRSSGPGGQHVNKVSTAVTLWHRPSGVRVTVQDSRSQAINRRIARERLIAAIEERQGADRIARRALRERERRRKSPRPAKLKKRILESKRKRSDLKKQRHRISE
ncbi:MAG: peptide chain release factor [Verrucomicrobiota bacterium]|jgi:protein subunit release factor B